MDNLLPVDAPQQRAALAVQPWERPALEGPVAYRPGHMGNCRMDGRTEHVERYSKQTRPLVAQHPLCELPKKLPADDVYEPQEVPAPSDPPERNHKTVRGQTLSPFPQYRRIRDLKLRPNSFCAAFNERGTSKACVCVHIAGGNHTYKILGMFTCGH